MRGREKRERLGDGASVKVTYIVKGVASYHCKPRSEWGNNCTVSPLFAPFRVVEDTDKWSLLWCIKSLDKGVIYLYVVETGANLNGQDLKRMEEEWSGVNMSFSNQS
ncbi:hypothetical protein Lal_00006675 [Lupinus albus]|nr:hypothetical protein Lal_00006675 [Lupinus albus]